MKHNNPIHKNFLKAKVLKYHFKKLPIKLVIGLLKVYFQSHKPTLDFPPFKTMHPFLNNQLIFHNLAVRNESRLTGGNQFIEQGLYLGHQDFSNSFIDGVA
jgi:hypothetical protein